MTPRKLEVGMKVAVYDGFRKVGMVAKVNDSGTIAVLFDGDDRPTYSYHPKQVRRLKPRAKARCQSCGK